MLGFCVLAPLGDAIAKLLGGLVPLGQLLLARFAIQVVLLLPIVLLSKRVLRFPRRMMVLVLMRTILHILGIGAMFISLRYLPLADAIAIAFVMPFIMLLLGKYVLNEEVGSHRLAACAVGFIGTLLVIQPSFAIVGWHALWPLVAALIFALFILLTRKVAKDVDPISLQVVSGGIAIGIMAVVLLVSRNAGIADLTLIALDAKPILLLLTLGCFGTVAHLLMTWSLKFAPASTLAPMQYLEIPVATFVGWVVFSDFPNGLAGVGILITVGAGLYVIWREQKMARQSA